MESPTRSEGLGNKMYWFDFDGLSTSASGKVMIFTSKNTGLARFNYQKIVICDCSADRTKRNL